jgi:hypothetical protein
MAAMLYARAAHAMIIVKSSSWPRSARQKVPIFDMEMVGDPKLFG